ncbi:MAG: hypothetical protein ACRYFZ_09705 [Janthinobacterium lividum]
MKRELPPSLIRHHGLPPRLRATLADVPPVELTKYEVEAVGQLLEMLLRARYPDYVNWFAVPADGLCAGRALVTNLLREEYLFTPGEIEAGRRDAETAGPARLLALFFHASATRRARTLARLQALADTAARTTNARVGFASHLAA